MAIRIHFVRLIFLNVFHIKQGSGIRNQGATRCRSLAALGKTADG
jgi:hypothetical protein